MTASSESIIERFSNAFLRSPGSCSARKISIRASWLSWMKNASRTASLIAVYGSSGVTAGRSPLRLRLAMVSPIMTLVATFASATPVAFEMNGTVREALGLASRT